VEVLSLSNKRLQQNQEEQPLFLTARSASVGFFGGLIWSIVGYVAYILNFTEFGPALILSPFMLGDWKEETLGQLIGIVAIALVSILVALFYKFVLFKFKTMWVGIVYGVALWFIVFYVLHPIFPGLKAVGDFNRNTVTTTVCLYILYGLFIGYSIAFDYHEFNQRQAKEENKEAKT
jgi:hypothetical protein